MYLIGCPLRTRSRTIVEENPTRGISKKRARSPPRSSPSASSIDGSRRSRPLRDRRGRKRQDPLGLVPARQSSRHVATDDQEQLGVWILSVQLLKGIDCVRRSLAPHLEIGHREPRIVLDGDPTQLQPVLRAGLVVDGLVRRDPGGHQHHAVEAQLKVRLLGADEVTKMWRVERPAENAQAHRASGVGRVPRPRRGT